MQLITSFSKYAIVALLSCCLLLVWYSDNLVEIASLTSANSTTNVSANTQTITETSNNSADSVWRDMSREFKLDHKAQSAQVQVEIRKLLSDQDSFYKILEAASPYIYYINKQTQASGLPAELALIPFIESEFNPNDRSNKGAAGLWQLMTGTAHELGVKVKSGYDGRRNVVASTNAALAYFKDLGNNFQGNWYLAIAAYNCGQGKVESAERRAGSHEFWDLKLPHETKVYVPKLLAVAAIIQDPQKYGVQLPPINNQPYFAAIKVNKSPNLTNVAKTSGVSIETLHKLNPDYYGHDKKPKTGANTLLVPVKVAPTVQAKLPAVEAKST